MYLVESQTDGRLWRGPNAVPQPSGGWMHLPVITVIGYIALFAVAFGNLVDIEASNEKIGFGGQAAVKVMMLALGGLYGGLGFATDVRVRRLVGTFPVVWMFVLLGFFLLAVPTSATPFTSLASTISIGCVLLMTCTALVQLGCGNVLNTLFYACGCFAVGSCAAYLLVPSVGVFLEPTIGGEFVPRMGGLSHPNALGQMSGLTVILGLILSRVQGGWTPLRVAVISFAAIALIGSLSRTSLLATLVAAVFVYRSQLFHRKYAMFFVVGGAIALLTLMMATMFTDIESKIVSKLDLLSKSGDSSELTSATGRTEIWGKTLELLAKRPLTGYGAATSKFYLQEYSLHTHNLVLNIAFSTGVIGGLFALWMVFSRLLGLFIQRHPIADALVVFILVNGLFENVIFSILCGLPTIMWTVALALPVIDSWTAPAISNSQQRRILRLSSR